jgi:anti-sigma28 factor (negative regulator of flagellin synthesis)
MKVDGTKDIKAADRVAGRDEQRPPPSATGAHTADKVTDKVTIDGRQVAEMLSSARLRSETARSGRLQQLETAIRSGSYKPDAGQLAEKLLSAAEVDARLLAMLKG